MDNRIISKNLTPKDILWKCKWFIEYNYTKQYESEITVSWLKNTIFNITWNPNTNTLYSNFNNQSIQLPTYAVGAFVYLWLKEITHSMKYPTKYLFYKYFNNRCKSFKFDMHLSKQDKTLSENFNLILEDIEKSGWLPIHLDFAKHLNVAEAFAIYINYKYKIKVDING